MALKQQPTLTTMVSEVLDGMNLGAQGDANADLHGLIRRMLRQAQATLWHEARWLHNRVSTEIELTEGVVAYDFPDDFEPGSLNRMYCRSNASETVDEWDLSGGITPADRSADARAPATRTPYRYDFRDGTIVLHPAPGTIPPNPVG